MVQAVSEVSLRGTKYQHCVLTIVPMLSSLTSIRSAIIGGVSPLFNA